MKEIVESHVIGERNAALAGGAKKERKLLEGYKPFDVGVFERIGASSAGDFGYKRFDLSMPEQCNAGTLHGAEPKCWRVWSRADLGDITISDGGNERTSRTQAVDDFVDGSADNGGR